MQRKDWMRLIRSAVFAAVLVVAQAVVLAHFDAPDTHPGADACVLCVGLATLGAANCTTPSALLPPRSCERLPDYQAPADAARPTFSVLPRGPPLNS